MMSELFDYKASPLYTFMVLNFRGDVIRKWNKGKIACILKLNK